MTKTFATGDIEQELAATRRVLERLPDEQWAWRPHEKSMTLGELATHIVNVLMWQQGILTLSEFDLATLPTKSDPLPNRDAVLEQYDTRADEVRASLAEVDEAALGETWTLRRGDHIMMQQPRALALRTLGVSHLVHHRAQLGVYLRMLDVPVPGPYGPSADEMGA